MNELSDQLKLWKRGIPSHAGKENCCPDFSCCYPELLVDSEDRSKYCDAIEENDKNLIGIYKLQFFWRLQSLFKRHHFTVEA